MRLCCPPRVGCGSCIAPACEAAAWCRADRHACPLCGGLVSCRGTSADGARWTISGVWGCAHVPLVSCGLVGWAHARFLCRVCVVCARRDPGVPPRGVMVTPRAPSRLLRFRRPPCVWRASACGLAIVVYLGFAKVLYKIRIYINRTTHTNLTIAPSAPSLLGHSCSTRPLTLHSGLSNSIKLLVLQLERAGLEAPRHTDNKRCCAARSRCQFNAAWSAMCVSASLKSSPA